MNAAAVSAIDISPALRAAVYAQGSDAPQKQKVKIGFIPLIDCASVAMPSVLGLDKKYGATIIPSNPSDTSWLWLGVPPPVGEVLSIELPCPRNRMALAESTQYLQ